jgi:YaeC family lipoprotein
MRSWRPLIFILALLTGGVEAAPPVRIGVGSGPEAEILELVQQIAARGTLIEIKLQPFADQARINAEVDQGKLDAASFEDGVAQAENIQRHAYKLTTAIQTVTLPMGLYSRKIHRLDQLPRKAMIALPQAPHELSRALILLHNYGLIHLREDSGLHASLRDVVGNPREYRLSLLSAAKLAGGLANSELVALDYPAAAALGLAPARDGLGMEDARSPYAGVLTVRSADQQAPWLKELVRLYHSEEVKQFILSKYQDSVRRPW